ncbi:flagellar basal body-associated FliL family protein [Roseivivax sp. CAU 1761]
MSDAADGSAQGPPPKASKLPLLLGLVLALAGGGGGFFAVGAGLMPGLGAAPPEPADDSAGAEDGDGAAAPGPGAQGDAAASEPGAFVELPPLVISIGQGGGATHLRFTAALEVPPAHAKEVARLQPRVIDAMNGYLRALDAADFEAPDALIMIRAQLTRRVELVLGRDRLRDLLVLQFVLS